MICLPLTGGMKWTAVVLLLLLLLNESRGKQRPPHIIFIVSDDLGWNDVGWHNPEVLTPNLNWLANRGLIMESTYALPTCTPSRNSYLTGMFPFHTPLQISINPAQPMYIPLKYTLLSERLKQLGYSTHLVGKWHLGFCNEKYTPTHRGFDSFYGIYIGSNNHYWHEKGEKLETHVSGSKSVSGMGKTVMKSSLKMSYTSRTTGKDFRFNDTAWEGADGIYSTHAYTTRAIDIINRQDPDVPLFLFVSFQAPHTPITAPLKYTQHFSNIHFPTRRIYLGMVNAIDEAVGNITQALIKKGLNKNMLLVFTSDNGGHPEMGGNNWPLRGGKSSLWEGGTRVPTFVYSETLLERQSMITHQMMHAADWLPTFVEVAGGKRVHGIDGMSQWPMISQGRRSPRQEFVYHIKPSGDGAIRVGDYKLIVGRPGMHNDWYRPPGAEPVKPSSLKGGKHDQTQIPKSVILLYNLKDDPAERNNLADQQPEVLRVMLQHYQRHNATKVTPFPKTRYSRADPVHYNGFWSPGWC